MSHLNYKKKTKNTHTPKKKKKKKWINKQKKLKKEIKKRKEYWTQSMVRIKSAWEHNKDWILYQLDPHIKKLALKLDKKNVIVRKKEESFVVIKQTWRNNTYIYREREIDR